MSKAERMKALSKKQNKKDIKYVFFYFENIDELMEKKKKEKNYLSGVSNWGILAFIPHHSEINLGVVKCIQLSQ